MFRKHLGLFPYWLSQSPDGLLWDAASDAATAAAAASGSGGSTSSGSTGTGSTNTDGAAAAAAAAAGSSAASTGTATAGKKFEYTEDRSKWVPPHRLTEETTKRQTFETNLAKLQGELELERRKLQALTGVLPADANAVEAEKVREAFYALPGFQHYRDLTPEVVKELLELRSMRGSLQETTDHHWNTLARSTFKTLETKILDEIGADELTPRQKRQVNASFMAMIGSDLPTFKARYESGDETLIDDFIKEFREDLIEPISRRSAAGVVAGRRPVPRGGSSAPVTSGAPKIDYSDPQAVEDEAVRRLKDAGMLQER